MEEDGAKDGEIKWSEREDFKGSGVSFKMKLYHYCAWALAVFALVLVAGCVTKATADADAKAAFVAGEKAAYQAMQSSVTSIMILGNVQKHEIPWVAGLTLAQAIATANYTGAHDPTDIILKRNSVQTEVDPKQLLSGRDVPLHPGDVVSVIGE